MLESSPAITKQDLKLLVIGSSIVRDIDASRIEKYSTAITECMPGARIEHIIIVSYLTVRGKLILIEKGKTHSMVEHMNKS